LYRRAEQNSALVLAYYAHKLDHSARPFNRYVGFQLHRVQLFILGYHRHKSVRPVNTLCKRNAIVGINAGANVKPLIPRS
jgi:hypothetical protein